MDSHNDSHSVSSPADPSVDAETASDANPDLEDLDGIFADVPGLANEAVQEVADTEDVELDEAIKRVSIRMLMWEALEDVNTLVDEGLPDGVNIDDEDAEVPPDTMRRVLRTVETRLLTALEKAGIDSLDTPPENVLSDGDTKSGQHIAVVQGLTEKVRLAKDQLETPAESD